MISSATNGVPTLKAFVEKYETQLLCYEMVQQSFRGLRVDRDVSIATYYRLAAPHILPSNVGKILYLDSDIIVRRSLEDLWNTDIQDYALAAVIDPWWSPGGGPHVEVPPGAKYFNAGVLLINLDYWRMNNVSENATAFARNNFEKVHYWDQDALNAILVDRWIPVPQIWNAYDFHKGRSVIDPAIVHFCGPKPWHWYAEHARWSARYAFIHEYRRCRRKTPWPRYRLEGEPRFSGRLYFSLRSLGRVLLPGGVRRWLRSRVPLPQA